MEGIQYTSNGTLSPSRFEQETRVKIGYGFDAGWPMAGVEPMGWRRATSMARAILDSV
jgi:hypothetical protein